ncbi:hypothetical protein [Pseudoxanthomonas sp.]|uniref:hypothetical protein n=1 Tax=Pseudoxanthomonas sp. TaxID=1871049 RepID=UPI00260E4A92|nr:hypothetical protein [Pseudoxanthomonas sp.]WDS36856.1 MAG: hypothetical protein O8I58_02810 [Pseudoxanthomonas sp.]
MGIVSSAVGHTVGAAWQAVKGTVQGALHGDVKDIARLAVVAGMANGSMTVGAGVTALAGESAIGSLLDVFA